MINIYKKYRILTLPEVTLFAVELQRYYPCLSLIYVPVCESFSFCESFKNRNDQQINCQQNSMFTCSGFPEEKKRKNPYFRVITFFR